MGRNNNNLFIWIVLGVITFAIILENIAIILAIISLVAIAAGVIYALWLLFKDR